MRPASCTTWKHTPTDGRKRPGYGAPILSGWATALAVLLALIWNASALAGPPAGAPPAVTVAVVAEREVNPPAEYVGRMEAIQAVDLRARVQGFLEEVRFAEGGDVKAGDLLYVIERAPYQAKFNVDKARVAKAAANLNNAQQYVKRLKSVRSGGVSESDLETAVSDELQAAAALEEARAALVQSELNLGYTLIKAPISGRIGRTAYTRGNLVGPESGALARIVQLDPIRVVYAVSETDFVTVKLTPATSGPGQARDELVPSIRLPNGALYARPGRHDFTDNQVDPATGTLAVRAVFDNPEQILLPGAYVNVLIRLSHPRRMPVVPQAAVLEDRDGRYVFAVEADNRVVLRRIATGAPVGTDWAVAEGLVAGESVIVTGVQKVRPGQIVQPVPAGRE